MMLYVTYYKIDLRKVEDLLNRDDTNVNAIVVADSPVWLSYTPLHVLMMRREKDLVFIALHMSV